MLLSASTTTDVQSCDPTTIQECVLDLSKKDIDKPPSLESDNSTCANTEKLLAETYPAQSNSQNTSLTLSGNIYNEYIH